MLVSRMHLHILQRASQPDIDLASLPQNNATEELADAIGAAVQEYGAPEAVVLFVVQPNERNSYDQQARSEIQSPLFNWKPRTTSFQVCMFYTL